MHARKIHPCAPGLDVSAKSLPRQRIIELNLKARLVFIYAAAFTGLLVMLFFITAPVLRELRAPNRDLLEVGFSQRFLKTASANLSDWREQLFINTISLQSAIERREMSRVQPQGYSRFNLFNPIVQCPKGEQLEVFGGNDDGAKFLCPSLLTKHTCVVYSLGSNLDYSFEEDILQRTSCQVVTFDCTVSGSSIHPRHTFLKKCLGSAASMEGNPQEWVTLSAAMAQFGHSSVTLLKIDIEGYEFDVLGATKSENKHALPAMIAMEMHYDDLYFGTGAWLNIEEQGTLYWPGHGKVSLAELSLFMFHLGNLGYAVVSRDDNPVCEHCSEFTLLRVE
ncbi:hypothetical protein NADE_005159 [Nannochloris sp. 'desiccata']|nr:hypothetical protein KSW81_002017 [Chlorella desiccata (nom. nud.)]KAH7622574.1 hypothetical protein NADE_005159 [Chlorella desiccata (nom. nud.)]